MTRKASDNIYLHKDFHCALNESLEYLRVNFGIDAVRAFLCRFATAFHAPLRAALCQRGLEALHEYFERIYSLEGGEIALTLSEDELLLTVKKCPAVEHIRKSAREPSALYHLTSQLVYETICEGTPFAFELHDYNPLTGACTLRFSRKNNS